MQYYAHKTSFYENAQNTIIKITFIKNVIIKFVINSSWFIEFV